MGYFTIFSTDDIINLCLKLQKDICVLGKITVLKYYAIHILYRRDDLSLGSLAAEIAQREISCWIQKC